MGEPRRLVDLVAGVEKGVQRAFGVDDQLAPARQADDHVGAQPAVVGVDRHLGLEVGIRRQAGLLEHVLEALLAPAAARLGAGAQRVDELRGLVADLGVAGVEQLHRLAQRRHNGRPAPSRPAQPVLVALQRRLDRLQQRLQLRLALLARLVEAGVGALEELLLRLAEQFGADLVELGRERLLGLDQLLHPRLEVARVGLERGEVAQRLVARPDGVGQLGREAGRQRGPAPRPARRRGRGRPASPVPRRSPTRRRPAELAQADPSRAPSGTNSEPRAAKAQSQAL